MREDYGGGIMRFSSLIYNTGATGEDLNWPMCPLCGSAVWLRQDPIVIAHDDHAALAHRDCFYAVVRP
jgi:hypothetical protein